MMYTHRSGTGRESKNKTMIYHCKKRFYQRFHAELTDNMIQYIVACIKKGKSEFVTSQSKSRTVHIVTIPINGVDTRIVVIYNKIKRLSHTVFPVEWLYDGTFDRYMENRQYINGED